MVALPVPAKSTDRVTALPLDAWVRPSPAKMLVPLTTADTSSTPSAKPGGIPVRPDQGAWLAERASVAVGTGKASVRVTAPLSPPPVKPPPA